ncbi:MAG: hypothetical protein GF330_05880 [Candidatus Eisenbacteria bacterium]|nr:hypothetical protein [Candidatus Eisenbacteria bacterium]
MMRGKRTVRTSASIVGCLIAALLCAMPALAYTGDHAKMQVRLPWPSEEQIEILRTVRDLDPMKIRPGEELILVSHEDQIARLEALGFHVEVQIPDMEEHYAAQRRGYRNFGLLYTYSEAVDQLDQLHTQYPHIVGEKFSIGQSWEGRDIWTIKVSDNPGVQEDEPEVYFDALHHAREPITVNVLIETIRYLCENYGSDPEVTFLVDNRQTYFTPVINPDGYVYNEQQYPGGGGMWRKNRRPPTQGCWGVDPNRNYSYEWGGVGSSGDPCDETYRGPEPFSEPETVANRDFMNAHEIVTHNSYHSVVGIILIPWGYTSQHTEDDALLRQIGEGMAESNGYPVGQGAELLYSCSGVTFDWSYGEQQTKPKIFAYTTEVDGSGFWPNDYEVDGLVAENIPSNLHLMRVAGSYLSVSDVVLEGGDGNGLPDPGETLEMVVTVQNEGAITDAENVVVTLRTSDPYVQLHVAQSDLGTIPANDSGSNAAAPFSLTIDPACPEGHSFEVDIEVVADAFETTHHTGWPVGDLDEIFADEMEGGVGDWTHEVVTGGFVDQWHQSTQRNHTAGGVTSWKFGDTGSGDYANLSDGALYTPIVESYGIVELTFWHWMDAEASGSYPTMCYDGGLIEASVNGGDWELVAPLDGYTHIIREGSTPGPFEEGTPCFSGEFDWREDTVRRYYSGEMQFRFRFGSDGADTREGWYVDDLVIMGRSTDNLAPDAPALVAPVDGETVYTSRPELVVENATDPEGDPLTYAFRVFGDELLTELVREVCGVAEGSGTTSWTVTPGLQDGAYYWHAYADDGIERGPCMPTASFTIEGGQGIAEEVGIRGLRLLGAGPNPAPGWADLRFRLGSESRVEVALYDLQGRQLRVLGGRFAPGAHALSWDGRDADGHAVPAGIYLYRLADATDRIEGRILMVR